MTRPPSYAATTAVRELNRIELAGESVRACVEALAVAAPDWLATVIDVGEWAARYGARVDSWRLPASKTKRAELMNTYGADAVALLRAVHDPAASAWLAQLPAVEVLRVMLVQNYLITTTSRGREVVRARTTDTDGLPPCRARLTSPYDVDARFSIKGATRWTGYKVHFTETCHPDHDESPNSSSPESGSPESGSPESGSPESGSSGRGGRAPNLIVGVATTDATVPDAVMTEQIHARLAERDLLPAQHLLDSGYPSARLLVESRRRWGVELITALQRDNSPQARAGQGFDRSKFSIDFDACHAVCPQGRTSTWWDPVTIGGTAKVSVKFAARTCAGCPARPQCTTTTSTRYGRALMIPTRELYQAQQTARAEHASPAGRARYAMRAGVEATIAQAVAVTGTRRARYRSQAKTQLEHVYSAVAINLIRLHAFWHGRAPDRGHTSHLTRLEHALAA